MKNCLLYITAALLLLCTSSCEENPSEIEDPRVQTVDFILNDLDGNPFQLSSTQGNVVMLNFFSTTCQICQAEADELNDLYREYRAQGVEIIGVAIRASGSAEIEAFVDLHNIPYRVLIDDNVVSRAYRVSGTPDAYFIDREGYTVDRIQGTKPMSLVENIIEALL